MLSGCTGSIQWPWDWSAPSTQPPSEPFNSNIADTTIPNNMLPGQAYNVSITIYNLGYISWSNANLVTLIPVDDTVNDVAKFNNSSFTIEPNNIVKTGSSYTWNITMVAPKWNGNYTIEYQLKDSNNTTFGQTLTKNITVGDLNSTVLFTSQGVLWYPPLSSMSIRKNTWQNVSITVKNNGRYSWSDADGVRLGTVDYESNNATLFNPTLLSYIGPDIVVNPGDQCTWKFRLQAPPSPGVYKLEYQMKQGDEWLGKPLIVYITVT